MDYGGYGDDFGGVQKTTDTARFVLGIIGIIGGILCAIAVMTFIIKGGLSLPLCCEVYELSDFRSK